MKFVAVATLALLAIVKAETVVKAETSTITAIEVDDGSTSVATVGPEGTFKTVNAAGATCSMVSLGAIAAAIAAFAL